ncbi:Protein transport protein sec16, partial [Trichostrongylus colubriformis]
LGDPVRTHELSSISADWARCSAVITRADFNVCRSFGSMPYRIHPLYSGVFNQFFFQNVEHSGLGGSAGGQQGQTNGNWDCINLGNTPSQQNHYNWSQHVGAQVNANRSTAPSYVDPYSAAVMGAYQQGAHNVVYPYQQHDVSSENYTQSTTPQGNMAQHVAVDQNYLYNQQHSHQQYEQQPQHSQAQYHQHQQQQLTKPSGTLNTQPVPSQHVHHTLVPTRQHSQQSNHHQKPVEHQNVTSQPYAPATSEPQSVPWAVISPAVALPSTAPQQNPQSTVQPFNSRSSHTEADIQQQQQYQQQFETANKSQGQEPGANHSANDEASSQSPLSYLAVHPVLSVQSPPAVPVCGPNVVTPASDSAQVTPESSYSVDTFGSGISSTDTAEQQRNANASSGGIQIPQTVTRSEDNWEDDWESTEHPGTGVAREVTPSDVGSQTQSEPPGYSSGYTDAPCATRESSVAPHDSTPHPNETSSDTIRVAPVSGTPSAVIGVPRYDDSCRSQDHVPAVAQVAPLRPEPESIQSAVASTPLAATQTPSPIDRVTEQPTEVTHSPQQQSSRSPVIDTEPTQQLMTDADVSVVIQYTSDSVIIPPSAEVTTQQPTRTSPDASSTNDNVLSPVVVQATSTPKTAVQTNDERNQQNQERHSWEPNNERRTALPNANFGITTSAADHSDSTTGSLSTRNGPERRSVQSRYKKFKEHFSGIMGRLDQYRAEPSRSEFRSSSRTGNPLMANVSNSLGRRSVLAAAKNYGAPPVRCAADASVLYNVKSDGGNASMYPQGDPSLSRSFDFNRPAVYGDDFVDAARRSRRSRLSRPNSRAKSEYGLVPGEPEQFDTRYPLPPPQYAGNFPSSGRRSVQSSMGVAHPQEYYVQQAHMYKERRRPQSSFDPRAMERYQRAGGRYGQYDTYDDAHSSVSEESDSDNAEGGDSEEEIRKYTRKGRFLGPGESFNAMAVGEEMYYFGAIHLDQARVRSILLNFPPPAEYHRLPPIEKAAYLFFIAVYKKQYNDIGDFHRKFNREYYKYTCDGDTDNVALWKICKSMQEEYHSKRLAESQKAYEASQRQLFSDDRESADGKEDDFVPLGDKPRRLILRTSSAPNFMSERASMDENHDDRTSDILSIDSSQRAPLKHRVPHAFVSFGPGGKMVTVHPDLSVSVVQIDDIKTVVSDPYTVRLVDGAQSFKGPLLIGQTPTHSVRLYIERQIKRIRNGEVASENPHDNDVIDCLLIWQLLGIIVQQQGRVTGPDVARLLVEVGGSAPSRASSMTHQTHHSHREKSVTPVDSVTTAIGPVRNQAIMDARAYERFTELLLGGHIAEAIDSALRDGLYADAMILARRLLAHDAAKLAEIEERFIATRPQCNPVVTLVSVSSKKLVPILMNPTGDDSGSWRTHAAIILANLTSPEAMETVYDLGKALAKRDYNCAADFCFLAVSVLAGINPFAPVAPSTQEGETSRQHITLIHACLPDDEVGAMQCRYGFSLVDLHATEIFDYAVRLSDVNAYSPLGGSIEYQRKRIQYAHLIAEFGGFATDAFKYCMEIARAVWNYYHLLSSTELLSLCDLADRLRYAASASDWETSWIASLRAMIQQKPQDQPNEAPQPDITANQLSAPPVPQSPQSPLSSDQYASPAAEMLSGAESGVPSPQQEIAAENRSRSASLTSEARDWHAQRQDPLQMSPVLPRSTGINSVTKEESDGRVSRSRTVSNASQHGSYDVHSKQAAEMYMHPSVQSHGGAHAHANVEEPSTTSEDTSAQSTTESTPIRTMSHQTENLSIASQPAPDYQRVSQQHMPPPAAHATQPPSQPNRNAASLSQNGLPETNMKKSNSTQGAKGFLSNIKEKLMKSIPSGNEMILPDDSQPTIVWDPVKGRYVGAGVEEETTAAPPPKMDGTSNAQSGTGGGLRAARTSGGSRYFNPLNQASTNGAASPAPAAPVPMMQVPATFGFIPSMPDDTGESVDPFSGQANPTVHGVELTQAQ